MLFAQEKEDFPTLEANLVQLSTQFLKDSLQENRITAATKFDEALQLSLQQKGSFNYPFTDLETVSILYPKDSTFRVFTWQVYVDKNNYRYGGLIQMNRPDNQVFPLHDQSADIATYDLEFDILGPSDWYGAIYFNIQEYPTKEGNKYLLFGFDGYEFFNKRKDIIPTTTI